MEAPNRSDLLDISESYWRIINEVWKEYMEKHGYIMLSQLIMSDEFDRLILERVRRN